MKKTPGRILVVDDDADILDSVAETLASHWDVTVATNGADALHSALQNPPSLVLSDLRMPRLDGLQLIRLLKANVSTKTVPIILFSASDGDCGLLKSFDAGADDYLRKPFSPDELIARIDVHLKLRQTYDDLLLSEQRHKNAINARDEILSILSHELKTPITALKLNLELARRSLKPGMTTVPEKLSHSLDCSTSQVDRLTRLVDDMLDVTRIRSGKMGMNFETTCWAELLFSVLEKYTDQLRSVGIKVTTELHPDGAGFSGFWDKFKLEQVLCNLFSNAIKYAPGSRLLLSAYSSPEDLRFVFRDFGAGIPKKKQDLLFHRFERATDSKTISGLGLGLYISKQIIEAHKGSIRLKSEVGKGTAFIIDLPMRQSAVSRMNNLTAVH